MVYLNGVMHGVALGASWKSLTTLPQRYRPDVSTYFAGASAGGDHVVQMSVEPDGIVYAKTMSGEVSGITFTASFPAK